MPATVTPGQPRSARRRARRSANGTRRTSLEVQLTAEQRALIEVTAGNQGVSLSRALVDAAFASPTSDALAGAHLEQIAGELVTIRRQLSGVATNVNQLAHHANATQEFPHDAENVTRNVKSLITEISQILATVQR